jgi:hypothetical protein
MEPFACGLFIRIFAKVERKKNVSFFTKKKERKMMITTDRRKCCSLEMFDLILLFFLSRRFVGRRPRSLGPA